MNTAKCLAALVIAMASIQPASAEDASAAPTPAATPSPNAQLPTVTPQVAQKAAGSPTAPDDPYPLAAAGWGPPADPDRFIIRWVEDWSRLRAAGKAPPFKAMPILGDDVRLTLGVELRLHVDAYNNGVLIPGDDYHQTLVRSVLSADLGLGSHFRIFGELADGQVTGRGNPYTVNYKGTQPVANYRNAMAVQQLFGEARTEIGGMLAGVIGGRQIFADGPRQLISISDGPNIHRAWNGVRFYLHGDRFRIGAFSFKGTALGFGSFDDRVNPGERLQGLNASVALVPPDRGTRLFLDPFWYHTYSRNGNVGATSAPEQRDTYGARLWGRHGPFAIDWTAARQTGAHDGRDIRAWFASLIQTVELSAEGIKPRIGGHIELASGGDSFASTGTIRGFNSLYQSSNYLGQGLLLGYENLVILAPSLEFDPAKSVTISLEYDFLRRMTEDDAVYGGLLRPYPNTQNVPGHSVGTFARFGISWTITSNLSFDAEAERLFAGKVLHRAGLGSGSYGSFSLTYRY